MKKAKNLEEVRKSIRDDHMVIIETGNTQCASCTAIQKKLDAFLKEHSAIEEHPEIASQFNILSVPTICLFIDRKNIYHLLVTSV